MTALRSMAEPAGAGAKKPARKRPAQPRGAALAKTDTVDAVDAALQAVKRRSEALTLTINALLGRLG